MSTIAKHLKRVMAGEYSRELSERLSRAHLQQAALGFRQGGTLASAMTPEQRQLYGQPFDKFAATLNGMQNSGLESAAAAKRLIEISEQVPAPSRAPVGADADEMLRAAKEKPDAELDALRLSLAGLG
jgi:hypothetical protein